jgi:hypothetical protein
MAIHAQRARGPAAVTLALTILSASFGCTSRRGGGDAEGVLISTSLPLASYVQAGSHGSADKGAKFFFPQLEIYDESGDLIYSSHESIENARVLKELPGSIKNLKPNPHAPRITEIMEAVPAFRQRKQEILTQHRVSILSVFLENCHACTVQEDALGDVEHRLLDHGINLLVLRVSRP